MALCGIAKYTLYTATTKLTTGVEDESCTWGQILKYSMIACCEVSYRQLIMQLLRHEEKVTLVVANAPGLLSYQTPEYCNVQLGVDYVITDEGLACSVIIRGGGW